MDKNVVLIENFKNNAGPSREKLLEIMMEWLDVYRFQVVNSSVMALYAEGRHTGLSVDLGADATYIVPVYEGFVIPHAIEK